MSASSSFFDLLSELIKSNHDKENSGLWSVNCFVTACIDFYETETQAPPIEEAELLLAGLKTCEDFSSSSFEDAIHLLRRIQPLLIERAPDHPLLKPIAEYLDANPASSNKEDSDKEAKKYVEQLYPVTLSKLMNPSSTGPKSKSAMEQFTDWLARNFGLVSPIQTRGWTLQISNLLEQCDNKKEFIRLFLTACQTTFFDFEKLKTHGYSIGLLQLLIKLMPTFSKHLPPLEFEALLRDTEMKLSDLENFWLYTVYFLYQKTISFYCNETCDLPSCSSNDLFKELKKLFNPSPLPLGEIGRHVYSKIPVPNAHDPASLEAFFQIPPSAHKELRHFIDVCITINAKVSDPHHQRNILLFFLQYSAQINQLISIMGGDGLLYLSSQVANTLLTLELNLSNMNVANPLLEEKLRMLYEEWKKEGTISWSNPLQMNHLKLILTLPESTVDPEIAEGAKSPYELLIRVEKQILEYLLQDNTSELSDQTIEQIFNRIRPEHVALLFAATQKMEEDVYQEIYKQLLRLDLLGGDVDEFLHRAEGDGSLAAHNRAIRARLQSPTRVLNYKPTFDFIVRPRERAANERQEAKKVIQSTLWSYLSRLYNEADAVMKNPHISGDKTHIDFIKNQIQRLKKMIGPEFNLTKFDHPKIPGILQTINNAIESLAPSEAPNSLKLPSEFYEFANHFTDQHQLLRKFMAENPSDKKRAASADTTHHFRVEQWDKTKAATFFLGEDVGCCLSPTGGQFQAMVQRRMDDAMLFHVATDLKTGKPVALIWLYLAEMADGTTGLVANFTEVNAKYGVDSALRMSLLNGLLEFTHQYLLDNPEISRFHMNPLTYGWNVGDLDNYPTVSAETEDGKRLIRDKLGGPFVPDDEPTDQTDQDRSDSTEQNYYIASLSKGIKRLFQFKPECLKDARASNPEMIGKMELIHQSVIHQLRENPSLTEETLERVVGHELASELKFFYTDPIIQDSNFKADIEKERTLFARQSAPLHQSRTVFATDHHDEQDSSSSVDKSASGGQTSDPS